MAQTQTGRGNTPPYVSYPSYKTLLTDLKEHGVPSRIDRSVLRRFSGVVGTQLLTALRFLHLVDDQSQPTERMNELVGALGTTDWNTTMIAVLQAEYSPLFGLDLGNATASHFDETFRKSFPGSDSVLQKSVAFFLAAAKDSGIIISDRVMHGRKTRTAGAGGKPRAAKAPKPNPPNKPASKPPQTETENQANDLNLHPLLMELLRKIPPEGNWPKEHRLRWFRVFAASTTAIYDDLMDPVDLKIELSAVDTGKASTA